MNNKKGNIIRRFALMIFSLIMLLGCCFIAIAYFFITRYHEAGTQLLNKSVAEHVAKFASPFTATGVDAKKADSVFYNAMVLNPGAEVYFLDTAGKIIAYHEDEVKLLKDVIPTAPLKEYIESKGTKYIKAIDPRDPSDPKIFSAAVVPQQDGNVGYIYVILNSKRSESIIDTLFGNHVFNLAAISFLAVIFLSLAFSLLYLKRLSKNYTQMIAVLQKFEQGDYSARFNFNRHNELAPITQTFNRMADLLSSAIDKLTISESERKNFIAGISHDLRTPLAIARGYTETLLLRREDNSMKPADRAYYTELVYSKLLQIENMVKQLFELSKMESAEFKAAKEPFVISEILQEVIDAFQLIAKENKIMLRSAITHSHVWVNADVSMMERVFQNLLENAHKVTPEGGNVEVSLTVQDANLIFHIKNTGAPLSSELLHWINHSTDGAALLSGRPAAAGLGLIIVQKILFLHGSFLTSLSESGVNEFSFSLKKYAPQHP
jgi:signal transduction histidine kinase